MRPPRDGRPGSALRLFTEQPLMTVVVGIAVLVAGGLQGWAGRYEVRTDGITFLEIADAYFRGTPEPAVHGVFSPLYSWVIGIPLWITGIEGSSEVLVVHATNFGLFVVALAAFAFFLGQLVAWRTERRGEDLGLPSSIWLLLGASLFTWFTLNNVTLAIVHDGLIRESVFLMSLGLLLRIKRGFDGMRSYAMLGATLGLGYLGNGEWSALAPVFVLAAALPAPDFRTLARSAAVAAALFFVVVGPWIVAQSVHEGAPTLGSAGYLHYAFYVNDVPTRHYQGGIPGVGQPIHPTRQLPAPVPVFEFATPVDGTYPPNFGLDYWNEGVRPSLDLSKHWDQAEAAVERTWDLNASPALWTFRWPWLPLAAIAGSLLLLAVLSREGIRSVKAFAASWPVLVPTLAVVAVHAVAIPSMSGRYLHSLPAVIVLALVAALRSPPTRRGLRAAQVTLLGVVAVLAVGIASSARWWLFFSATSAPLPALDYQRFLAQGLEDRGVQEGHSVVVLGDDERTPASYWARVAGVRIVGEIRDPARFWSLPGRERARIVSELERRSGARWIVALDGNEPPAGVRGWTRVGDPRLAAEVAPLSPRFAR